jgi:hypothetical protein
VFFLILRERERERERENIFPSLFFLGRGRLRGILFRTEQGRNRGEVGIWSCAGVCKERNEKSRGVVNGEGFFFFCIYTINFLKVMLLFVF